MRGNEKTAASETIIPPTTAFLYDAIADCQVSIMSSNSQLSHQPIGRVETMEWIEQQSGINHHLLPGYHIVDDHHHDRMENNQSYP